MDKRLLSKLISPKEIPFSEVKKIFWSENGKEDDNSRWPFHLINNADEQLGKWISAELPYEVFAGIKLPYHTHKGKVLVPRKGLTVEETYKKLKEIEGRYRKSNPDCVSKIDYFANHDIGTIILSSATPSGRDSYEGGDAKKHLIHIDGLHRMLGEMCKIKEKGYKPVKAFIAVREDG